MIAIGDEYLREIGKISVNFSALEVILSAIAWRLMGSDQQVGQIVTSQLSFNRLVQLVHALAKHKVADQNVLQELDNLLSKANQAEDERNSIIHAIWAPQVPEPATGMKETVAMLKIKLRKGALVFDVVKDVPLTRLQDVSDSIGQVAASLVEMMPRLS